MATVRRTFEAVFLWPMKFVKIKMSVEHLAFLLTAVSMEEDQTCASRSCQNRRNFPRSASCWNSGLSRRWFREQARFFEAWQEDVESVMEWSTHLKKLVADCNFGEDLNTFIKKLFVMSRRCPIFERVCTIFRRFDEDCAKEKMYPTTSTCIKSSMKQSSHGAKCFICGRGDHDFRKCQYKSYVCKLRDKKRHLARVWATKTSEQPKEKTAWKRLELFRKHYRQRSNGVRHLSQFSKKIRRYDCVQITVTYSCYTIVNRFL